MVFGRLLTLAITLSSLPLLIPDPAFSQDSKENADFKLALNLFNDELYELAAEQFKQFIGSYPNTTQGTEARFYLGLAQKELGLAEEARLTFQTFALTYQNNPKAPDAWWNVGEIYSGLGNHREAALAYERVKVFHPRSARAPQALVEAGRHFQQAGMPDDARRVLRIVLQEYPSSDAVHKGRTALAELYFNEGNTVQAENELIRVIEGDPSPDARAQALLILGDIYAAQWRFSDAKSRYDEIIRSHSKSTAATTAYVHLGLLQNKSREFGAAAKNLEEGLRRGPVDSLLLRDANLGLGMAYEGDGEYTKAVRQYEKLLTGSSDEHKAEILWYVARAYGRAGNSGKVLDTGRDILAAQPSPAVKRETIALMAGSSAESKRYSEALQLYSQFLETFPGDQVSPYVLMEAAIIARDELGDTRRAVLYCETVISRYPHSPQAVRAHSVGAGCYEELGDIDRSIELWNSLVRKYPSSESAPIAERRIRELETFQAKDKDAALERLALLLGDVVAGHDKEDLSFRLGETYFNHLKNYRAAAAQFTNVINSGLTDKRFEMALLYRSRSYEYLSWSDETYRQRAIDSYRTFIENYNPHPEIDAASFSFFELHATSISGARSAYETVTTLVPDTRHKPTMLLEIGILQQESDSLVGALDTFSALPRDYPSSAAAQEASYRRFSILLDAGQSDLAAAEGERYVSQYPRGIHSAFVLSNLGEIALSTGNGSRSSELFSSLVNEYGFSEYAEKGKESLARAYFMEGKHESAIRLYSEMIDEYRNDPFTGNESESRLLLGVADAYHQNGRPADARRSAFEVLEVSTDPKQRGEAFALLGMVARDEGKPALASAYFRQAAISSPGVTTSREVADLLFESEAYPEAIDKYRLLVAAEPTPEEARHYEFRIILSELRSDRITNAEKHAAAFSKKYRNTDEEMGEYELGRGNYYFRNGNYTAAASAFSTVRSEYDDTDAAPEAMYWTGKTLEVTGKQSEARELYEDLLQDYPTAGITLRAHLALGNLSYNAEEWDKAVQHYRRVVEDPGVDPELLPFAMSNLIETYDAAGVYDAALDLARKYLDRFPSNEDSFDKRIRIGILYQRLGYHDQSIVHLQGLLDQAGPDLEGEIRYYIAEGNFYKGEFQQAILDFLKVPYLVTKKGKIDWTANSLYMAGQSYEKLGRYDQAVAMYKQIIDRPGIDGTFKAAARKEIDRVNLVLKEPK